MIEVINEYLDKLDAEMKDTQKIMDNLCVDALEVTEKAVQWHFYRGKVQALIEVYNDLVGLRESL